MSSQVEKKVEVQAKLKLSDMLRYNMYIAYRSWLSKIMVVISVALIGWVIYKGINRGDMGLDLFISYNIVWIIVPFLILISTPWRVWKITAMQMQSPIFAQGSTYIFYEDRIFIQAGEIEDEVPWETYSRIVETNKDFRLFVDAVQAQLVPKHNLKEEEITTLRELIKKANPESVYSLKG